MHTEKILIPLYNDEIAPRFDLATDVLIVIVEKKGETTLFWEAKVVILAHASPEEICRLVIAENMSTVICAGIEDEYFQFLAWKGIRVIDDVLGSAREAAKTYIGKGLVPGTVFYKL